MSSQDKPRLLGISGSLRQASFNTIALQTLADSVGDQVSFTLFSLKDLPLYNQDLDNETPPEAVQEFRDAMSAVDGLVIRSPEYNYGISGVLKNALDWASRPYGKSKLTGKPVLTITASPAFTGGVRAQSQLAEILIANAALLVLRPQAVISLAHEKIKNGRLTDAPTLDFLIAGVHDLLRDVRRRAVVIQQEI